jgi:UDP-glucuronate 4-epimerase
MLYLVTGNAGFIGFHLTKRLLEEGQEVVGVDNLNPYYDPKLKKARLEILKKHANFSFYRLDIANLADFENVFTENKIDKVCHLAAQAGVRYSLENPHLYEQANMVGFLNLLELMRKYEVKNLVYASSSSVYGGIKKIPFSERMKINKPISLYAATKAANELYAHVYHHLYGFNTVGLRFFTVYGPWGRPDMALFLFTKAILEDKPIKVFNQGQMKRDFTYVDDIVDGIMTSLNKVSALGYEVFNLGCANPVNLLDFIKTIEKRLGKKAKKEFLPLQPGDMPATFADVSKAKKLLGYQPKVKVEEGVGEFVNWYRQYYQGAKGR